MIDPSELADWGERIGGEVSRDTSLEDANPVDGIAVLIEFDSIRVALYDDQDDPNFHSQIYIRIMMTASDVTTDIRVDARQAEIQGDTLKFRKRNTYDGYGELTPTS